MCGGTVGTGDLNVQGGIEDLLEIGGSRCIGDLELIKLFN